MEGVRHFLDELGLGQYADLFREQGFDNIEDLRALDKDEIELVCRSVGITKPGHLLKLRRGLKGLSSSSAQSSAAGQAWEAGLAGNDLIAMHEASPLSDATPEDLDCLRAVQGVRANDFEFVKYVGGGANGIVMCVTCSAPALPPARRQDQFALKLVFNWGLDTNGLTNTFVNEFNVLSSLPFHPNVTRFWAEFIDEIPDWAIPHLPGMARSMATYTQGGVAKRRKAQFVVVDFHPTMLDRAVKPLPRPTPFPTLLNYTRGLARALAHLHALHTVHLDLKSDNALVSHRDAAVLCDFGTSKRFPDADMSSPFRAGQAPGGNFLHLAPEVLTAYMRASRMPPQQAASVTIPYAHTEVWALGCLVHEIGGADRSHPLPEYPQAYQQGAGANLVVEYDAEAELPRLPAAYPQAFCSLVQRMLSCEPDGRPSWQEVLQSLDALAVEAGLDSAPTAASAIGGGAGTDATGLTLTLRAVGGPGGLSAPFTVVVAGGASSPISAACDAAATSLGAAAASTLPGPARALTLLHAGQPLDRSLSLSAAGVAGESVLYIVRDPQAAAEPTAAGTGGAGPAEAVPPAGADEPVAPGAPPAQLASAATGGAGARRRRPSAARRAAPGIDRPRLPEPPVGGYWLGEEPPAAADTQGRTSVGLAVLPRPAPQDSLLDSVRARFVELGAGNRSLEVRVYEPVAVGQGGAVFGALTARLVQRRTVAVDGDLACACDLKEIRIDPPLPVRQGQLVGLSAASGGLHTSTAAPGADLCWFSLGARETPVGGTERLLREQANVPKRYGFAFRLQPDPDGRPAPASAGADDTPLGRVLSDGAAGGGEQGEDVAVVPAGSWGTMPEPCAFEGFGTDSGAPALICPYPSMELTAGRWYWEVLMRDVAGRGARIGLADAAWLQAAAAAGGSEEPAALGDQPTGRSVAIDLDRSEVRSGGRRVQRVHTGLGGDGCTLCLALDATVAPARLVACVDGHWQRAVTVELPPRPVAPTGLSPTGVDGPGDDSIGLVVAVSAGGGCRVAFALGSGVGLAMAHQPPEGFQPLGALVNRQLQAGAQHGPAGAARWIGTRTPAGADASGHARVPLLVLGEAVDVTGAIDRLELVRSHAPMDAEMELRVFEGSVHGSGLWARVLQQGHRRLAVRRSHMDGRPHALVIDPPMPVKAGEFVGLFCADGVHTTSHRPGEGRCFFAPIEAGADGAAEALAAAGQSQMLMVEQGCDYGFRVRVTPGTGERPPAFTVGPPPTLPVASAMRVALCVLDDPLPFNGHVEELSLRLRGSTMQGSGRQSLRLAAVTVDRSKWQVCVARSVLVEVNGSLSEQLLQTVRFEPPGDPLTARSGLDQALAVQAGECVALLRDDGFSLELASAHQAQVEVAPVSNDPRPAAGPRAPAGKWGPEDEAAAGQATAASVGGGRAVSLFARALRADEAAGTGNEPEPVADGSTFRVAMSQPRRHAGFSVRVVAEVTKTELAACSGAAAASGPGTGRRQVSVGRLGMSPEAVTSAVVRQGSTPAPSLTAGPGQAEAKQLQPGQMGVLGGAVPCACNATALHVALAGTATSVRVVVVDLQRSSRSRGQCRVVETRDLAIPAAQEATRPVSVAIDPPLAVPAGARLGVRAVQPDAAVPILVRAGGDDAPVRLGYWAGDAGGGLAKLTARCELALGFDLEVSAA